MDLDFQGSTPAGDDDADCQSVKAKIDRAIRKAGLDKDAREVFEEYVWPAVSADYAVLVEELKKLFYTELKQRGVSCLISGRTKTLKSIRESVDRREKHRLKEGQVPYQGVKDILKDIHDFAGIRIVLNFQTDIDKVEDLIKVCFQQVDNPTEFSADRDVGKPWKTWFGAYTAKNHRLCLNIQRSDALPRYHDILFEVQVTDIAEHQYNALAHPFLYKDSYARLDRGDEMVIDISHAVSRVYALCLMYMKEKVEGTACGAETEKELGHLLGPAIPLGTTQVVEVPVSGYAGNMATQTGRAMVVEDLISVIGAPPDTCDSVGELRLWLANKWNEIRDANQASVTLQRTSGALHDSSENGDLPLCYPGTSAGILGEIDRWAMDDESRTILWVYGPAGFGKSTISLTVAHSLYKRGLLGASYFFKRGHDDRNNAPRFIPTLASQLMASVPGFKKCLRESLEESSHVDIETKAMDFQFEALVWGPLSRIPTTESPHKLTRVIVIDALDECELRIEKILPLLRKFEGLDRLRLRVLITSRHTHPIDMAFKSLDNVERGVARRASYRELALHRKFLEETKEDIAAFLREKFAAIKANNGISGEWPDPNDLSRIVNLATSPSPLFIYAATLCRFIYDGSGRGQPTKRLTGWLKQCDSNTLQDYNTTQDDDTPQLGTLYLPILNYVLFGTYKPDDKPKPLHAEDQSELRQILSAIVFLATPLSGQAIETLLGLDKDSVNHHVGNLHAVLDIPSVPTAPVRLLHQSFRDFLISYRREDMPAILRLDETETHTLLARRCISLMEKSLKRNICKIQHPGTLMDEVEDDVAAKHISAELKYACLFWVHHVVLHERFVLDGEEVYKFLKAHFLHWMECLSLLRRLSDGMLFVRMLSIACQPDPRVGSPLATFLRDAEKFIFIHGPIMNRAPLQIYLSALAFTPATSEVKRWLGDQKFSFLKSIRGVEDMYWQSLEGHQSWIRAVAFSPDGNTLASASNDGTVRLWDTVLGTHQRTLLEGHGDAAHGITFSPESKTITGLTQRELSHRRVVTAISFSPDSKIVASGWCGGKIRLWDAWDGSYRDMEEGNSSTIRAIAFSPNGDMIASGSDDGAVRLWDARKGTHLHRLEGHTRTVSAIVFSPNSTTVASGSHDNTIRLWDLKLIAQTLRPHALGDHRYKVTAIAISPDCKIIASASASGVTVQLWDSRTGALQQALYGAEYLETTAVAFSPNGKLVAAHSGVEIHLWDAMTGAHKHALSCDLQCDIAFSPNSEMVAAASPDEVWVWDAARGQSRPTPRAFRVPLGCIPFSPGGKVLDRITFSPDGKAIIFIQLIFIYGKGEGYVDLWDSTMDTHRYMLRFKTHLRPNCAAFSPDSKTLALSTHDRILLLDTREGTQRHALLNRSPVFCVVTFSPDNSTLAAASDNDIHLWDVGKFTHLHTLKGHTNWVTLIVFSPDGRTVGSASYDQTVRLWDVATGAIKHTLEGQSGLTDALAFSPSGNTLSSASPDNVLVWNVTTGSQLHALQDLYDIGDIVAISAGGKALARASRNGDRRIIQVWDAAADFHPHTFNLQGGRRDPTIAFSPSGTTITSISPGRLQVWDVPTSRCTLTFKTAGNPRITVSSDGQTIAWVSQAQPAKLYLWDVARATRGHPPFVCSCVGNYQRRCIDALSFSPAGKTLAALCSLGTLHLWDVTTGTDRKLPRSQKATYDTDLFSSDAQQPMSGLDTPAGQKSTDDTLAVSGEWITRRGRRILWIPKDYRGECMAAVTGDLVVFGHGSGMTTLQFDLS